MKIVLLCLSCILLIGCESEKAQPQEDYIAETQMTEDMRKIKDILVADIKEEMRIFSDLYLRTIKVTCELYGTNNRLLNKELDKIAKLYGRYKYRNEQKKFGYAERAILKGLKLNYNQIPLLIKELAITLAEIASIDRKSYAPYETKIKEILKDIQTKHNKYALEQILKKILWNEISDSGKQMIMEMQFVVDNNNYNEFFDFYQALSSRFLVLISEGTLKDSFLEKSPSPLKEEDEYVLLSWTCGIYRKMLDTNVYGTTLPMFDVLKKFVKSTKINERKELEEAVARARTCLESLISYMIDIQSDIAATIDHCTAEDQYKEERIPNFYDNNRYMLVKLMEKYPKFEDFEKQIDALSTRLAYSTYNEASTARFLYDEWRSKYSSQMNELFENSRSLAERFHNICKGEKISDSNERMHERNMENIATIREITSIGTKILSASYSPLSQQKIKAAYKNRFMKMREIYLRHMEREVM
ncbi:hypothetical protein FACS189472_05190 [Alphaproteobacteria bacterium]|nr:hypothetical protein FACS189472_05190 [Alphaproteobacteria bacterium]